MPLQDSRRKISVNRMRSAILSLVAGLAASPLAASTLGPPPQTVGIVVNGTALVFDQPPFERDGRVFVPLRGLFERLGASVVFELGQIAITAGSHTIGLHVGDAVATIDGRSEMLDAPPVVVADRTLVPLRFVAQALGAEVAYDVTRRVVSVSATPRPSPAAALAAPSPPEMAQSTFATNVPVVAAVPSVPLGKGEIPIELRLLRVEPAPNATLARRRPEISATFAESVDAATVRVVLDGHDTALDTFATSHGFATDPSFDLDVGMHVVSVTGRTPDKERFEERWTFATSDAPNANYLSGLEPVSGATLGSTNFEVSGFTRPKARVRIVATTSATSTAFSDFSDGSATVDAVANSKGYFAAALAPVDHGAGLVDVRIASTAPGGAVAIRTLRLQL